MVSINPETILLVLLAVLLGAVLTLGGVALGALAVFRTKREPHERLFRAGMETGDAFVMDDLEDGFPDQWRPRRGTKEKTASGNDVVPGLFDHIEKPFKESLVGKHHQKFMEQMGQEIKERSA
jgi:hypothetical protein